MPDFAAERALAGAAGGPRSTRANTLVAGVDEAGRGPLAGPVVAAAVCFPGLALPPAVRGLIDDSKRLTPARRETAFAAILEAGTVGMGAASVAEIDRLNILQATLLAMQRAVAALAAPPAGVLVDGNRAPDLPCPARPVVGGDRLSLSIAAASIVAKVTRDRIMARLAAEHPGYGWERNAGYGVAAHRAALAALGPTPHHRRTFAPVREMLLASKRQ
ncbi:MAG: ribonuclease HII [Rhodospirillaceae bacterium]|nr:ribonuclease HII [Rhodospirillaceae bacterium]MYF87305.1 ribonuclease HII [Rhodospirillaceae bacterium]MYH38207.1 ribonuclease HII [Rhodospirillaceae bacterium]MYK13025.1 ribonuclease HII [Rhodospirillaceae bacterium]